MRTLRFLVGFTMVAALLPLSATAATATPAVTAVYNAVPSTVPGNVPSQAFEATSTSEFGDLVRLAPGPRVAHDVSVVLSSWGCEFGNWNGGSCVTTPGDRFSHNLTLTIYSVDRSGPTPAPGAALLTKTQPFEIPYRPSADNTYCTGADAGKWFDGTKCYNGFATTINFDVSALNRVLPSEVIWTVAYNTSDYGAAPIGHAATCYTSSGGCGYDSLNVGAQSFAGQPSVGTDVDQDGAVLNSTWSGAYCDSGTGGTGSLRIDTGANCWTDYRPLATISTTAASLSSSTVVVKAATPHGWSFVDDNGSGSPLGTYVTGPASPPLGTGSANLTTTGAADGQMLANPVYAGTKLADLTALDYSSYQSGPVVAPALQFDVRYHPSDSGYQGRLVFEPYQNGAVTVGSGWQNWTGLSDKWWASKQTAAGANGLCPISAPCTWAQILTNWPNASILGNTLFKVGSGWPAGSFNVDAFKIGVNDGSGNVTETTYDFEATPQCTTVCYADASGGNNLNGGTSLADAKKTIQAAINQVSAGGQVRVLPGTYNESAPNSAPTTIGGTYQFGLFFPSSKPGITLMGVDTGNNPITDAAATLATINTDATNNFGYDGIFVEAADTTIQGVKIGPNVSGDNKTIEVVADNFTLRDSTTDIPNGGGSIYIDDFSTAGDVVQSYHVLHNIFPDGTSVDISSGAGSSTALTSSNREILNNTFDLGGGNWNAISFNGADTGVPWFVNQVGGAVITGNTFAGGSLQYIRARGTYHESEFDWKSFWNDNSYDKGAVALVTETPFDVRQYSYPNSYGTFNHVRRIGASIQGEVDHTLAGDTVLVKPGTYPEHVTLGHALTLKGANAGIAGNAARGPESKITGDTSGAVQLAGDNVTINGFEVQSASNALGTGIHMAAGQTGALITDNLITGNQMGIYANSAGASMISYNLFDANNEAGSSGGSGIYSEYTDHMTIDHNEFRNHTTNNPIIFGATGANVHKNLVVSNNFIHDNVSGIYALGVTDGSFMGNDISAAGATALSLSGGDANVSVTKNLLHDSARGVRIEDGGYGSSLASNSAIHINRNSITGNTSYGINNVSGYTGAVDGVCNWYGSASGPTNVGNPGGAGDTVLGSVAFAPWLATANLNDTCLAGLTFLGYTSPLPKIKLSAKNSTIPVKFKLGDAAGNPLPASIASTLVVRVTLTGDTTLPPTLGALNSAISTIEPCPYNVTAGIFKCNLAKPRGVHLNTQWYWISTTVKDGTGYFFPTNFGAAMNPEPVTFK